MTSPATEIIDEAKPDQVKVRFDYLNTNDHTTFDVAETALLGDVWSEAYMKLGEAPKEGDQLQCADGRSMMGDLNLTIAELKAQHICPERHFQIRSQTGGA